jgi:hypothetical protein
MLLGDRRGRLNFVHSRTVWVGERAIMMGRRLGVWAELRRKLRRPGKVKRPDGQTAKRGHECQTHIWYLERLDSLIGAWRS